MQVRLDIRQTLMNWKSAPDGHWLLFVIFYGVLANCPFWAASPLLGILRNGWFCLEYTCVGLIALFVPCLFSALLLLLLIAADLVCGVSQTYYLSPTECLLNIGSVHELSTFRLLIVAAVIALALLVSGIAARFPFGVIRGAYRLRAAACLVVFAAVCLSVDCTKAIRKTGKVPNPFHLALEAQNDAAQLSYFNESYVSRLPLIRLVRNEAKYADLRMKIHASPVKASPFPSAAAVAVRSEIFAADKKGPQMPNFVIVLVESWGLAADLSMRSALVQPYMQPALLAHYEVLQGTVPFYGPTIAGEARELCGNNMGFHILNASAQGLQGCLPDQLAALGYHGIALHGMDGHMFSRSTWYSTIGFQEEWFRSQFRQQGLPDCAGAFTGTCDATIAEWMRRRLETKDANPQFLYWVTLNSHLPVPVPAPLSDGASCSISPFLSQQPALCSWYQIIANVHLSVSQIAMGKLARPTVFVIVGDHAPAFADPALRSRFTRDVVPYVLLFPRQKNQMRPPALR
jgi:hypothetical protein